MSIVKKQKLEDISIDEKKHVILICESVLLGAVLLALFMVSCVACSMGPDPEPEMTNEQKAAYWSVAVMDAYWYPMVDGNHNGILKNLYAPRDVKTVFDSNSRQLIAYFMFDPENFMDSAVLTLESEFGKLNFDTEDEWTVKFSEKNEIKYMTITDSDGKVVYYSDQK